MSNTYIPVALRHFVEKRAKYQCEYCLLPANLSFFSHEIDHIIAEKHGGKTEASNLAYTCWRCNRYKGTDLGSFDPKTLDFCFLFNPRTHQWNKHFEVNNFEMSGLTGIGRTTVKLLRLNHIDRVAERKRIQQI